MLPGYPGFYVKAPLQFNCAHTGQHARSEDCCSLSRALATTLGQRAISKLLHVINAPAEPDRAGYALALDDQIGGGGNRTRVQSKFHKDIYIVIALFSHYAQSQPIIGVRWATTIFGCLSSLPDFFQSSSVRGDSVTRATRSLRTRQREREHC